MKTTRFYKLCCGFCWGSWLAIMLFVGYLIVDFINWLGTPCPF